MIQNIIAEITKRLGITEEQAKGGLGVLLKFCQEKLAAADFKKITDIIGSSWQEIIKAAPAASSSMMGKFASVFSEKAGAMANLVGDFKKVGIDMSKVQQFVDVTIKTLEEKGGPQVKEMLSKFLKK